MTTFRVIPSSLPEDAFVARFGGIYEHSPWVAEAAWARRGEAGFDTLTGLHGIMRDIVDASGEPRQLALINAHPDLAGKAAAAGTLTDESTTEQASAGLDQCTPEELSRFTRYNDAYKARFGFPFIMAVRNSDRHQILAAFAARLENSPQAEFQEALRQIHRIALWRLEEL
ncbi:2-oxo-4-hydroxy-4-carboxy-5-ureidoimidazoline decarboxylase [Granulosicoccaceae sp. 1_MG-2023]|nr:2-oxo-4-hydroxy-4-carboxy-5-ureidoimidazoline decarboxylase [Granulosicoccaceae sp. 1_MG-2023]